MKKALKFKPIYIIILINLSIFLFTNIFWGIHYEEVDDFIIYNLYSGLDGTYNVHGIYIHPLICAFLGGLYKLTPLINWHTIFLLMLQFISFNVIGITIYNKFKKNNIFSIYAICMSIIYPIFLLLIQYTSTAALTIIASLFLFIEILNSNNKNIKKHIFLWVLFSLGFMLRDKALLLILPFFALYGIAFFIKWIRKEINNKKFGRIILEYTFLLFLCLIAYVSNLYFYLGDKVNEEFLDYTKARTVLHDLSYLDYERNESFFKEIGWSKNDHFLFYKVNMADENVYSKEKIIEIVNSAKKRGILSIMDFNVKNIITTYYNKSKKISYLHILFLLIFLLSIIKNPSKKIINIFIFVFAILVHVLLIIVGKVVYRVLIPEYVAGIFLLLYNTNYNFFQHYIKKSYLIIISILLIILLNNTYCIPKNISFLKNIRETINYTNMHKENVYLYSMPSLQLRFLAYSPYKMPPPHSFSNLRIMGGWDMYTQNYFDFKSRNNLNGNFLDLLKNNVYFIDTDNYTINKINRNYVEKVKLFIKEHYNINVGYNKIKEFDGIYIYKFNEK